MMRRIIPLAMIWATGLLGQMGGLDHAWELAANGRKAEAIQLLQGIVRSEPANPDARLLLGSLFMEQGDRQQSIEQLTAAVNLRPRSEEAANALGEAYNRFGNTGAARKAFEKALTLKPDYGIAQLNLGQVLLAQSDLPGAAAHLQRAVALLGRDDDAADAYYLEAKVSSARNETEQAAKELEQAVHIRPRFASAWADLGQTRKLLLDDAGALAAFEKAVALNPRDAIAEYRLGVEYVHLDKDHEAVEHLKKADELNPADQSTLNALQLALRQEGDTEGANRVKQRLAELLRQRDVMNQNKLTAVRLNNEGAALEKAGDVPGALPKYKEAARLDPDHEGIQINYGAALLRLGRWTEGLEQLHDVLLKDPENVKVRDALKEALAQAPAGAQPAWKNEVH